METNATTTETFFDKAENYTKTSLELVKLKTVSTSADVLSTLTSKIVVGVVVAISTLFLNVGLSLWIGKLLGEYYFGFFIMAFVYLIFVIVLHKNHHKLIKIPIANMIISSILKEAKTDTNDESLN